MIPPTREENLPNSTIQGRSGCYNTWHSPTSQPKKTGTPALISLITVDFKFSISVLTSKEY